MMIGIIEQSSVGSLQSTAPTGSSQWFKSWRWTVRWLTWTLVFFSLDSRQPPPSFHPSILYKK